MKHSCREEESIVQSSSYVLLLDFLRRDGEEKEDKEEKEERGREKGKAEPRAPGDWNSSL